MRPSHAARVILFSVAMIAGVPGIASAQANLTVGAGKSAIDIPAAAFPVDGFTAEHDKLQARVVLLSSGSNRVALAVVDQTSISEESVSEMKEIIRQVAGVDPANIFICASHTFSAPHVLPAEHATAEERPKGVLLQKAIDDAVLRSAGDAMRKMRPARIGFGLGASNVNVNRDVLTADGWWLGSNESGVSDKSVAVIKFEDLDGRPLAILLNYGVQSSIMNESIMADGGKLVTSDLAGAAVRSIEQQYGNDAIALFLVGAAGDQAPYLTANRFTIDKNKKFARADIRDAGYVLVDLLGERLGTEAVRVSEETHGGDISDILRVVNESVDVDSQASAGTIQSMQPTKSYEFQRKDKVSVPVAIMQIGDVVLVGLQAELSSETGIDIKRRSPFPKTIVMTMVNGAAKYLPDAGSYDRITYEAMSARYAKGAAEIVSARIIEILNRMHSEASK